MINKIFNNGQIYFSDSKKNERFKMFYFKNYNLELIYINLKLK